MLSASLADNAAVLYPEPGWGRLPETMHILVVKMTSLGDVVHMLPALTEAMGHVPDLRADWVVEDSFAAIPGWHPAVERVIPIALRRWRRALAKRASWREIGRFRRELGLRHYDLVVDSQGLIKSALVCLFARGERVGLDRHSAREGLAALAYARACPAPRGLHAITRNRLLMAQALGYRVPGGAEWESDIRYGISPPPVERAWDLPPDFLVCLHGTARPEKEYPEEKWISLLELLLEAGHAVVLPWGNDREYSRAQRLARAAQGTRVLPRLSLGQLAGVLGAARGVIGVDTGLMHLAAAFRKPGLGLYPATPPGLYGVRAEAGAPSVLNLSADRDLRPEQVAAKALGLFSRMKE